MSDLADHPIQELTPEQLDFAVYIYIGQNIRDEGILKSDVHLEKNAAPVNLLIEKGIVEQARWYKLDVLRISYMYKVALRDVVEERLYKQKESLRSTLQAIPENLLSFLVFEYLSSSLSFPVDRDYLFDWKDILLADVTIRKHKKYFFDTLIDFGFCVKTHNYVSTKGGELREEDYTIAAEVRNTLRGIVPVLALPSSLRDLANIHKLIQDDLEYKTGVANVTINNDAILAIASQPEEMEKVFDAFLHRLQSSNAAFEIKRIPGIGTEIVGNRNVLLQFTKNDANERITKPLLSHEAIVKKEEKETPDFLRLVQRLIDRKFSLYRTAAQFGGREIFKSLPYIERCVIDLTRPLTGEEGLQRFVTSLHQVLEESSAKEILKFREGEDFTSMEEWLEVEIPHEASPFYEDAKKFFRDLNRLRNFYSHTLDAKGIFESGEIFYRLIGKYSPEEDDIVKTEVILLERSIRSLDGLERALRTAWQEKVGSSSTLRR